MTVTSMVPEWQLLWRIGSGMAERFAPMHSASPRPPSVDIPSPERSMSRRIRNHLALTEAGLRSLFIHIRGPPKIISSKLETQLRLLCWDLEQAGNIGLGDDIVSESGQDDVTEGPEYPRLSALAEFLADTSLDTTAGLQFDIIHGANRRLFVIPLDESVESLYNTVTRCNEMLDDLERGNGDTVVSHGSSTDTAPLPSRALFRERTNKVLKELFSRFDRCPTGFEHEIMLCVSQYAGASTMPSQLSDSTGLVFDLLLRLHSSPENASWLHTQGVPRKKNMSIEEIADICSKLQTWDNSKILQILHDIPSGCGIFWAPSVHSASHVQECALFSIDSLLEMDVFLRRNEARDRWPNLRDPRYKALFTLEEKVTIAMTVSRGFMDFLDAEARLPECDGRKIHLLVPNGRRPPEGQVYLPFTKNSDTPITLEHDDPTRLALAKVLLEIEKGEKIDLGSYASPTLAYADLIKRAQNAAKAGNALYAKAVTNCLNLHLYIERDEEDLIAALRETMRKQVVGQLLELKTALNPPAAGNRKRVSREEDTTDSSLGKKVRLNVFKKSVAFITPSTQSQPPPSEPLPPDGELLEPPRPRFLGGQRASANDWIANLKEINAEVERARKRGKIKKSAVRIAILDTGVDLGLLCHCYEDTMDGDDTTDRSNIVVQRADFVDLSGQGQALDTFGHGTFMTKLVMECAPSVEISVARVAKSTASLEGSEEQIAKAIIWAGCEQRADIISMSFGFPRNSSIIEKAIDKVKAERGRSIIFLASAGNTPNEDENFPARHPSVISIYATNRHGYFSHSNARSKNQVCAKFGTYGDDIPPHAFQRIRKRFPKACEPGSSVATAVAAGIYATMLAYIEYLPSLDCGVRDEDREIFKMAREKLGAEALFDKISDAIHGDRFINPVRFWEAKNSHHLRYCAILDCLQDVHVKHAR